MKQTSTHEYIYNGNDGRKERKKEILEHNASMLFIILFYLYYLFYWYICIYYKYGKIIMKEWIYYNTREKWG